MTKRIITKANSTPEEWSRHISEVRRAAAKKALTVIRAKAEHKEKTSSVTVFRSDAEKIRAMAIEAGVRNQDIVRQLIEEHEASRSEKVENPFLS